MDKLSFMSELKFLLDRAYGDIDKYEIKVIVGDYEEYFREGQLEGKSEDEIVESLGYPKDIVADMVRSDIEDGKYNEEDFKRYYAYISGSDNRGFGYDSTNEASNEINRTRNNIGKNYKRSGTNFDIVDFLKRVLLFSFKFVKLIISFCVKLSVILFTIFGVMAIVSVFGAIIVGSLVLIISMPFESSIFEIIGQNRLILIFQIAMALGGIVLSIALMIKGLLLLMRLVGFLFKKINDISGKNKRRNSISGNNIIGNNSTEVREV